MNILISSFTEDINQSPVVHALAELFTAEGSDKHNLARTPEAADIVLFVDLHLCADPALGQLWRHPLMKRFANKSFVYDERDEPWCALPGVYVSMPKQYFDPARQRAFGYYASNRATLTDANPEPDLLFSFIGTPGHVTSGGYRVRKLLLGIQHLRAVIEDSSGFVFYDDAGNPEFHRRCQRRFADVTSRSKFVICPRGRGTSSIRMYEAIRAGRVPVVLSDEWVAPAGPRWETFTLTAAERDAKNVASIIEANEHRWDEMSRAARDAYERWFSPQVAVGRIFDLCAELLASPAPPKPYWRCAGYSAMRMRAMRNEVRRIGGRALRTLRIKS